MSGTFLMFVGRRWFLFCNGGRPLDSAEGAVCLLTTCLIGSMLVFVALLDSLVVMWPCSQTSECGFGSKTFTHRSQ